MGEGSGGAMGEGKIGLVGKMPTLLEDSSMMRRSAGHSIDMAMASDSPASRVTSKISTIERLVV